ncbi:MAG TPA: hypothetical protein VFX70_09475 [Mycobacteriales bacterium]|nr:hypothetical protein [Mycobacteriales bacterium]
MAGEQPKFARRRVRRDRSRGSAAPPAVIRAEEPAGADQPEQHEQRERAQPGSGSGPRPVPQPPRPVTRPGRRDGERSERGLRGLVGSGPSQVGVSGALRARDAARPSAADLAAADKELVVVRRHYVPPDRLTGPEPSARSGTKPPDHAGGGTPEDS